MSQWSQSNPAEDKTIEPPKLLVHEPLRFWVSMNSNDREEASRCLTKLSVDNKKRPSPVGNGLQILKRESTYAAFSTLFDLMHAVHTVRRLVRPFT